MKKNLIRAGLLSISLVTFTCAREVIFKNNDDFPMTISWAEETMTMSAGGRRRPTTSVRAENFSETIPPQSERTLNIGQGPGGLQNVKNVKVAITQRYKHLNVPGVAEFPLNIPMSFGQQPLHVELNVFPLLKLLLGAQALMVNYEGGRQSIFAPDWKQLTGQSAGGFSFGGAGGFGGFGAGGAGFGFGTQQQQQQQQPTRFDFQMLEPEVRPTTHEIEQREPLEEEEL